MASYGGELLSSRELTGMPRQIGLTERLKGQREDLRKRVADLDSAIAAIEANPSVQEVLDALSKMGEIR